MAVAEVQLKTESWANTDEAFAQFAQRVADGSPRNLLARKGVKSYSKDAPSATALVDGYAGVRGGEGRVGIGGQPSVITFYLGEPKVVREVGFFTFNIDVRANQDYEVRFADNSKNPGKMPTFPDAPHLTIGDKVIGPDSGGFHSRFVSADGTPLVDGNIDWIEFRIWRTYNVKAGHPARSSDPQGWAAAIELEVWGLQDDIVVLSAEELARRQALRNAPKSPDYEKKATWRETMIAAREAIVRWECEVDRLQAPDCGIVFGPWHAFGAVPKQSESVRKLDSNRLIDLSASPGEHAGKALAWQSCPGIKDGELADMSKLLSGKKGDLILLCRTVEIEKQFERRNPFCIGAGLGGGRLRLLPGGTMLHGPGQAQPAVPNQRTWSLTSKPGTYQILAILPVADDGSCDFWFAPQPPTGTPAAGNTNSRISRRRSLFSRLRNDFPSPVDGRQLDWEQFDSIWMRFTHRAMAGINWELTDWRPGRPDFLLEQYTKAAQKRIEQARDEVETAALDVREQVGPWLSRQSAADTTPATVAAARERYYAVAAVQDAAALAHSIDSMRLAVEDQKRTFGNGYPQADEYLERVGALATRMDKLWPTLLAAGADSLEALLALRTTFDQESQEILLSNPLLRFDKLLLIKGGPGFSSNWGGPNRLGNEIVALSPVRPDGALTTIHAQNAVSNIDLSFDASRILFSDGKRILEVGVDGKGLRSISDPDDQHVKHYDPCYLPDGRIMFVSTACEQAVPCTGQWYVGNMHTMDADGQNERRLTFDQDHNWNPCVLNNGRVIYTRWEYTDTPHYFSRLLFHMNPDGTNQSEYYGSNSYWPNSMFWPRPIPGHPSMIVCIVSGHHGIGRRGELLLLDPAKGRHEADGVVQRIPGRGRTVEPLISDGLVQDSWPRFAAPYPLAEPETNRGAGTYFLVTCRLSETAGWGIYLADVFDNLTPLLMGSYSMPVPLRPRQRPPIITPRVDLKRKDASVYMVDVYNGPGIRGCPKGTVKALRLGAHHYRYGDNGDTRASSYEGGWDVKRIIGTVPVNEDGSAFFTVPANTPLFVQPLDAEGKALQTMRSWFVAMPGEVLSCVGCHEKQNVSPPSDYRAAFRQQRADPTPWLGPPRGFSFDREVQPVLDRRCAGCHNGQPRTDGRILPDLRAKRLHQDFKGNYSPAYMALHPYVRRAGYEADYHMPAPSEFNANTSPLVQMLKKGHHNVTLSREEWERFYTWTDFNLPYPLNWRESHRVPKDEQVQRRAKYLKLLANVDDTAEAAAALPDIRAFEPPPASSARPKALKTEGWPVPPEQAIKQQEDEALADLVLDLGDGTQIAFAAIPAGRGVVGDVNGFADEYPERVATIEQPFYLSKFEVTNAQFARFDAGHDSAYIEARGKDRFTRGYPVNEPEQPVVRVSWQQAEAFCTWLSQRAGYVCRLPSEDEWEYACRAGTATPWSFGAATAGLKSVANVADSSLNSWGWGRCESDYHDGVRFSAPVGKFAPNAWGLHDMHGNVAEWTATDYTPSEPSTAAALKVVRGGSWNDTFRTTRSASRWRYPAWQPVYNVGFRVLCEPVIAVTQTAE